MEINYKKILLGMLGEKIVAKHLRDSGCIVEESLNIFDSDKDMVVDGKNIEVKTNAPLFFYNSFTVSDKQYNKIINSHRVYWLSVPLQTINDEYAGCIFEMDPSIVKSYRITMNNRSVTAFKRIQLGMKIVHKIEDPAILKQLKDLSTSYL